MVHLISKEQLSSYGRAQDIYALLFIAFLKCVSNHLRNGTKRPAQIVYYSLVEPILRLLLPLTSVLRENTTVPI